MLLKVSPQQMRVRHECTAHFFFVIERDLTVPHPEPERLSAPGHLVYVGKREQGVQACPSHITPIIIIWTVRHYEITTGAPLSSFESRNALLILTLPVVFIVLTDFKCHVIIETRVRRTAKR